MHLIDFLTEEVTLVHAVDGVNLFFFALTKESEQVLPFILYCRVALSLDLEALPWNVFGRCSVIRVVEKEDAYVGDDRVAFVPNIGAKGERFVLVNDCLEDGTDLGVAECVHLMLFLVDKALEIEVDLLVILSNHELRAEIEVHIKIIFSDVARQKSHRLTFNNQVRVACLSSRLFAQL